MRMYSLAFSFQNVFGIDQVQHVTCSLETTGVEESWFFCWLTDNSIYNVGEGLVSWVHGSKKHRVVYPGSSQTKDGATLLLSNSLWADLNSEMVRVIGQHMLNWIDELNYNITSECCVDQVSGVGVHLWWIWKGPSPLAQSFTGTQRVHGEPDSAGQQRDNVEDSCLGLAL